MSKSDRLSRRDFVRTTATAGAVGAAAPCFVPASALGQDDKPAASERIGVGLIGCGGMGRANLSNCAKYDDVAVTGVCDVWKERREKVTDRYKTSAKPHHDYRELLQRKDVDVPAPAGQVNGFSLRDYS